MAGYAFKNEQPFSDVYFTGMVRDKQGRKMSKSLGNSPDLLDLIDKYGADAVRFGIMISSPAGNDLLFDENALEQGRNFNNKLWNALKLVKIWEERVDNSQLAIDSFATDWFDNRLNEVKAEVEILLSQFKLSEALKTIYSLIWDDFCSWYLEWVKPGFEQPISKNIYDKTISYFEELMQLLHPFMPFITEEIFHLLKEQSEDLCVKQFEIIKQVNQNIIDEGDFLKRSISEIKNLRSKFDLKEFNIWLTEERHLFMAEIFNKNFKTAKVEYSKSPGHGLISIMFGKIYIETETETNNKDQLLKELEYLKGFLIPVQKKLSNEKFVQNANPEVIELERKKQSDAEAKIKVIEESLANL